MRPLLAGAVVLLLAALLAGCTSPAERPAEGGPAASAAAPTSSAPASSEPAPTLTPGAVQPDDLQVETALRVVRHLAGEIGPRHGTSSAFRGATRWVSDRLTRFGYDVQRQTFAVPAGLSWGVPVPAGRSANLVATRPGTDLRRPHLVVGAHLDTVPQAPGAEDNASGVGVLLAVAEALAARRTRLPVVLVVFGAEEPRGPGDDDHHYGSRHYVAMLGSAQPDAVRGMVSLDRVGVGDELPICSAGPPDRLRSDLLAAARRAGVQVLPCTGNRASDHWSFVRNGLPGVRLGSTPYAAYHSADDVPAVVGRAQLRRAGRTVLAWLSPS